MILFPLETRADFIARGWWRDEPLTDFVERNAACAPDVEALVDGPDRARYARGAARRLTWAEVARETRALAGVLHEEGLRRDDVLLVQLPNVVELIIVFLAAWRLGVIVTPAPAQHRAHELGFIAEKTGAKAAITALRIGEDQPASRIREVAAVSSTLTKLFAIDGPDDGVIDLGARMKAVSPHALTQVEELRKASPRGSGDVITICWTSGTEAEPKGVPRSSSEWLVISDFVRMAAKLRDGARTLAPFPIVNQSGVTSIATWLDLCSALVLHHPFDLDVFLAQLRDERIDFTLAAPALLARMLERPDTLEAIDFSRLNTLGSGSAALSPSVLETFKTRYGVDIVNNYGSNEGAGLAATPEDIPDFKERAAYFARFGHPEFGYKFPYAERIKTRLVDPETGEEITQPGRAGEIRFKGPTVFAGYWRAPDLTAAAFDEDGWYRSGDLFEIAGEGGRYYRFLGRHKDIIVRGGMNISSEELENHLNAHPAVTEAAVIGAPDPVMGERICACIAAAETPPTIEALNIYLREEKQVAVYKQIERLEVLDALPRNPVGKILKRELRAMIHARLNQD